MHVCSCGLPAMATPSLPAGGQPARGYIVASGAPNPESAPTDQKKAYQRELMRNSLPMVRFAEYMKEAAAKHVLMVFDSCFAGTIFSALRSPPSPAITRATGLPARQFITSGTAAQTVRDDGTFQQLFVRAISGKERGADPNNDGYVTASELGVFLSDKLTNLTRKRQTPVSGYLSETGFDRGDFVFVASEANLALGNGPAAAASVEEEIVWRFVRDWNSEAGLQQFIAQYPNAANRKVAEAQLELLKAGLLTVPTTGQPAVEPTIVQGMADQGFALVKIFYATNRKPDKASYGSETAPALAFGTSTVAVPAVHKIGEIERPSVWAFTDKPDPKRHFTVMRSATLSAEAFS